MVCHRNVKATLSPLLFATIPNSFRRSNSPVIASLNASTAWEIGFPWDAEISPRLVRAGMSSSSVTQATFLSFRAMSAISQNSKGVLFAKSVIFIIISPACFADPYRFSNATRVFSTSFPEARPIQATESANAPAASPAVFRPDTIAWVDIQKLLDVFPMDDDIPSPASTISFFVVFPCSPMSSIQSRIFLSSAVALSTASRINCTFWLIGERVMYAGFYFSRSVLFGRRARGICNPGPPAHLCSVHRVCAWSDLFRCRGFSA